MKRWLVVLVGAVAAVASFAMVPPRPAAAAPPAPVSAEGDSYALGANVSVLGAIPINPAPIAPALATVPSPPNPKFNESGTVICAPNCVPGLVDNINVTDDTGKAFVPGYNGAGSSTPSTDCLPNVAVTAPFVSGPLTGGNGCSTIAAAGLLGAVSGGVAAITTRDISSQSLTQSCTSTPVGVTTIAALTIGGINPLTGLTNIPPNTTVNLNLVGQVPVSLGKVILNEQKFEDLSGATGGSVQTGHGLIVNAAHIILDVVVAGQALLQADIILGHTSSRAVCDQPVTPLCPSDTPAIPGACVGNPITKTVVTPSGTDPGAMFPTAHPGDQITYTISITNTDSCSPTQVVDTLPPGFTLVSASGVLGTNPLLGTVNGQQTLTFRSNNGFGGGDPLVEKLVVLVGATVPPGTYVDGVDVLSNCGETPGSGGEVTVPANPVIPTQEPLAAATNLPNTSSTPAPPSPAPLVPAAVGVGLLGLTAVGWRRIRALRR
ncbi:MAG: hypothetical protein WAT58_06520 [Candidatus Dormiibacterota bacterium]